MKFKKANEGLCDLLEETMASFECQKRRMFGSPVWFVNGNMVTGVHQDDIFIRLSLKDREKLLSESDEASPFEPLEGRIMKEYVVIPNSIYDDPESFDEWLNKSFQYVSSLPPKKKKKR